MQGLLAVSNVAMSGTGFGFMHSCLTFLARNFYA